MSDSRTIQKVFFDVRAQLSNISGINADLEADWIVEFVTQKNTLERLKNPDVVLQLDQQKKIESILAQRTLGEPLAYVLGEKYFYGFKFKVNSAVLIPRPETELLVDWALEQYQLRWKNKPIRILDMGTGSGCLAVTLAKKIPQSNVVAIDISPEALVVARENAHSHNIENQIEFVLADIRQNLPTAKAFELIVANPPYIEPNDSEVAEDVRKFEPAQALFSAEGTSDILAWLKKIKTVCAPGASVGFEIGARQGQEVLAHFRDLGVFSKQYILKDYSEHDRFVCGEI